jgi:3D (Asp-Asp-Asp) domain-containing protein
MKKLLIAVLVIGSFPAFLSPTSVTQATNSGPVSTSTPVIGFTATNTAAGMATTLLQPQDVRLMRITAYTSLPDETDSTPFITANGTYVHSGIVATNLFPFGTKIEIPALFGDRVFVVEDRMSPRFNNTIDIWMPTRGDAVYFGLNYANVVILANSDVNISEK